MLKIARDISIVNLICKAYFDLQFNYQSLFQFDFQSVFQFDLQGVFRSSNRFAKRILISHWIANSLIDKLIGNFIEVVIWQISLTMVAIQMLRAAKHYPT